MHESFDPVEVIRATHPKLARRERDAGELARGDPPGDLALGQARQRCDLGDRQEVFGVPSPFEYSDLGAQSSEFGVQLDDLGGEVFDCGRHHILARSVSAFVP